MDMNYPTERCFGAMIGKLRCFGNIGINRAGAVG